MTDPQRIVQSLRGLPIWSAIVGPMGQYALSIELGEQQRRPVRLANPRLSFVKRTFEGTHALLVECPWRIEGASGLVASAFEAFDPEDAVVGEHAAFDGVTVDEVALDPLVGDLTLALSSGLRLRCVVLEMQRRAPERINWSMTTPEHVLTAGPRGRLQVRSRAEAEGAFRRMIRALDGEDDLVTRMAKSRGMTAVPPLPEDGHDDLVVDEPPAADPASPAKPEPGPSGGH